MTKYDPDFWEVSVDPAVLEAVLAEPDFVDRLLTGAEDQAAAEDKEELRTAAVEQILDIIETKLTERQRQIVEMYFFDGKTQQEIAHELGINQQVVSKHLFGTLRDGRK